MTGYQPAPYLLPAVGPMACFVIVREVGDVLDQHAASLEQSQSSEAARAAGQQLRVALAGMREAARQWRARESLGSAPGTAEPSQAQVGANSERPLFGAPLSGSSSDSLGLGTRKVAEICGVSDSLVRRWCRNHGLSATNRGYVISPEMVQVFKAKRRSVA